MIIRLEPGSAIPPYAQIQEQIATMIRSGVLQPDGRLPAIRHLANDLGIAVNTVARAYRELELAGLVVTRGRHGTVVREWIPDRHARPEHDVAGAATAYALEASHRGLDLDQALDAVRRAFHGLDNNRRTA